MTLSAMILFILPNLFKERIIARAEIMSDFLSYSNS